jgi:tetratricopeptide (TPR) repeat protein
VLWIIHHVLKHVRARAHLARSVRPLFFTNNLHRHTNDQRWPSRKRLSPPKTFARAATSCTKQVLLEAVACYKHAAELAPSEATPLSNLSAAYFELGQYTACRDTCQAALKLLKNGNDLAAQKLHLRSLKASLLLKNIDHARDSLAGLDLSDERDRLKECLDLLEDNRHGGLDVEMRIVSDLLLTKPKL